MARAYSSPSRDTAAAKKRVQVLDAASQLLRDGGGASLSMEAVAKASGVTRLTVYKQFGSRRGLLEAVFDDRAERQGLNRIPEVMATGDARAAINQLIEIFCVFWSSDSALGRLNDEAAVDAELAAALGERNERRRQALAVLVDRMAPLVESSARRDAVDLLFALSGHATFRALSPGRSPAEVCALIQSAGADALRRLG